MWCSSYLKNTSCWEQCFEHFPDGRAGAFILTANQMEKLLKPFKKKTVLFLVAFGHEVQYPRAVISSEFFYHFPCRTQ